MLAIFISCSLLLLLLNSGQVKAAPLPSTSSAPTTSSTEQKAQVLIINQVRGDECCHPGQLEIFQQQLELIQTQQLPAVFTLRYDALNDPAYQAVIEASDSEWLTWGLFLEVTPQLAQAAGVEYTAAADQWHEAQHAYTLGYSLEDRRQLVDELMASYHDFFGHYPLVTTSWILDTPMINYLRDEYQVELHQLTREQWGTDSYTLYGGPPHYPYFASRQWAFLPGTNRDQAMLMVRQTVTDPVWNYGDTQARFTSQPNDYQQDGKDFSYFQALLEQALFQQPSGQRGFALLGLENSMATQYQETYRKQLEFVAQLAEQDRVELPQATEFRQSLDAGPVTVYAGQDLVKDQTVEAWWLTGQTYRLRLLRRGQEVMIDDLRLYDSALNDYYATHQAQDQAFWVTPFLLDGSRFYTQEKTWLQAERASDGLKPMPDVVTQPQAWTLPALATEETELKFHFETDELFRIDYETTEGNFQLQLRPTQFGLGLVADQPPRRHWLLDGQTVYDLNSSCDQGFCWYRAQINPKLFARAQEEQREAFLPEAQLGELDPQQSKLYAHNPFAVAGKNPVRLVFMPRDSQGLAVQLESAPEIIVESDRVTLASDPQSVLKTDPQFYDFSSQAAVATTITFRVEDQLELTTPIYFAPNCKNDWLKCWRQPRYLWWYGRSWLQHKRQLIEEKWQNWLNY